MPEMTWDPSVFTFLQRSANGRPLFPNIRELVWHHPTSELLTVVTPTIRTLRLAYSSNDDDHNYTDVAADAFRARRHAFKAIIHGVLRMLPDLEQLTVRPLGHEGFWKLLALAPSSSFIAQNIRRMEISESLSVQMRGALFAVSTIPELTELKISHAESCYTFYPLRYIRLVWDKADIQPFARLRRLRIYTYVAAIATILDAINAPELADIDLYHRRSSGGPKTNFSSVLPGIVRMLCDRNAESLRMVSLDVEEECQHFYSLVRPLFTLHQLRDLEFHLSYGTELESMALPDMVESLPVLERLTVSAAILTLKVLRALARASPGLQSLTVRRVSGEFSTGGFSLATPASQPGREIVGHALRELHILDPEQVAAPADVSKLACFLDELFPQLEVERCIREGRAFEGTAGWNNVLRELGKLQDARRT
ncbi:hypothetical protein C8Q72DRAFT_649525 [Fomitopsis betulina]|nr:hypothetical protein C8Q72DRAFT_649525 [Fomitopsis betulina]